MFSIKIQHADILVINAQHTIGAFYN